MRALRNTLAGLLMVVAVGAGPAFAGAPSGPTLDPEARAVEAARAPIREPEYLLQQAAGGGLGPALAESTRRANEMDRSEITDLALASRVYWVQASLLRQLVSDQRDVSPMICERAALAFRKASLFGLLDQSVTYAVQAQSFARWFSGACRLTPTSEARISSVLAQVSHRYADQLSASGQAAGLGDSTARGLSGSSWAQSKPAIVAMVLNVSKRVSGESTPPKLVQSAMQAWMAESAPRDVISALMVVMLTMALVGVVLRGVERALRFVIIKVPHAVFSFLRAGAAVSRVPQSTSGMMRGASKAKAQPLSTRSPVRPRIRKL